MLGKYDPANILKKRYKLKGWKAEAADWGVGFAEAAVFYFILLPLLLGAYPPAVVVQTCSMAGVYNVGDVAVMGGTTFDGLQAPALTTSSLDYTIVPNNVSERTQKLVFSDGQELAIQQWGDIVLYNSGTSGEQIIHRAIAKVTTPSGRYILTKGDANNVPDSVRLECAEWVETTQGTMCKAIRSDVSRICTSSDVGWPGCLGTPVPEKAVLGKALFSIPLVGHVKMLFMHIITLGHGYPGTLWC